MSNSGLPRMPWFPRDFRSSTLLWPLVARAVYRELLDLSWDVGGLPSNPDELRALVRASPEEWVIAWPWAEAKFPVGADGMRRNPRLETHRAAAQEMHAAKRKGAALTNAKRWGPKSHADSVCESDSDSHTESLSDPLSESPPAPAPAPSPDPRDGGSFGASRPLARTSKAVPAYKSQEFHQQVIAAYHELLPGLPVVKVWSDKRAGALNARITETIRRGKPADQISYWRSVFEIVADSPHLLGDNDRAWTADLAWLVLPENFAKVIEGRYLKRQRATPNEVPAHGR